ncbi:unnamed protein product [Spirodela intermedia]|uniref:Uncharacterized protein n=1 Tax=Spirodela intermedia TaxID=51605 RepID=A0A7I8KQ34_SPIIN|nr:unnamed protein product [Spirodela intermedia]
MWMIGDVAQSLYIKSPERKNGDFAVLRWLSPNGEELDGGMRNKRRLFIASGTLSGGGDLSLGRSSSSR